MSLKNIIQLVFLALASPDQRRLHHEPMKQCIMAKSKLKTPDRVYDSPSYRKCYTVLVHLLINTCLIVYGDVFMC